MSELSIDEAKACCATGYGGEVATFLLGDNFHPGGESLTRSLVRQLALGAGDLLVDVASGRGGSAIIAARETGCRVLGIDLSDQNVALAEARAAEAGWAPSVTFACADAERLPVGDADAAAVLCECALCLFPDKECAAAEFARVLRPGGRLALSDMVTVPHRLPEELRGLAGWVSCVADARPLDEVVALLDGAGFVVSARERHDAAVGELLDRVEARLRLARVALSGVSQVRELAPRGLELVRTAREALADGALGYCSILAHLPA